MNNNMLQSELNEPQRITPDLVEAKRYLANRLLDRITKTNVYGYYLTYMLLISYFTYHGLYNVKWFHFLLSLAMGALFWTLIEYVVHRFLFHWNSSKSAVKLLTFMLHGIHHAYPRDVPRSITPLVFTLPAAAMFYLIFKLISGIYVDGVFAGFMLGYVLYSIIHDSTHHFAMNFPLLKQLKINHMRHHYFDIEQNYGVSTPLWDILFKTYVNNHAIKNRTANSLR